MLRPQSIVFDLHPPQKYHKRTYSSSLDHATDYENDIILLTCANGKQCNQLIPFLLPKWKNLRLAVSSDSSRQQLLEKYAGKSKAHVEVVLADIAQPNDCKGILDGVAAVYHVGPSSHTRETEIGSVVLPPRQTHLHSDQPILQLSHDRSRCRQ